MSNVSIPVFNEPDEDMAGFFTPILFNGLLDWILVAIIAVSLIGTLVGVFLKVTDPFTNEKRRLLGLLIPSAILLLGSVGFFGYRALNDLFTAKWPATDVAVDSKVKTESLGLNNEGNEITVVRVWRKVKEPTEGEPPCGEPESGSTCWEQIAGPVKSGDTGAQAPGNVNGNNGNVNGNNGNVVGNNGNVNGNNGTVDEVPAELEDQCPVPCEGPNGSCLGMSPEEMNLGQCQIAPDTVPVEDRIRISPVNAFEKGDSWTVSMWIHTDEARLLDRRTVGRPSDGIIVGSATLIATARRTINAVLVNRNASPTITQSITEPSPDGDRTNDRTIPFSKSIPFPVGQWNHYVWVQEGQLTTIYFNKDVQISQRVDANVPRIDRTAFEVLGNRGMIDIGKLRICDKALNAGEVTCLYELERQSVQALNRRLRNGRRTRNGTSNRNRDDSPDDRR